MSICIYTENTRRRELAGQRTTTCPVCHRDMIFRPVVRDGVTKLEAVCLNCDRVRILRDVE